MKLGQKPKDNLATILMCLLFIVGLIFLLIIVPYIGIKDTIESKGGIVWYTSGRGRELSTNYHFILSGVVFWGLFICFLRNLRKARQKIRKRQERLKNAYEQLSAEEKAIQHKIDDTTNA